MSAKDVDKEDGAEMKGFLDRDFEEVYQEMPVNADTQCGYSFLKGRLLQKFANKKAYVIIHGILGAMLISTFSYFNGILTTLEKRFSIPSRNTGIILSGYDCVAILSSPLLSYAFSKKHRPRWVAANMFAASLCCLFILGLHLMYGPGEDALSLTTEYGATSSSNATGFSDFEKDKALCIHNASLSQGCDKAEGSMIPQIYLFTAQGLMGLFAPLYDSVGTAYMDDNIQKAKTPLLISVSYCLRMLGPAFGYTVASLSLKEYIAPGLTPTITQDDSRWLGAWWLGLIFIFGLLAFFSFLTSLFPKELPRAHLRRLISVESAKSRNAQEKKGKEKNEVETQEAKDNMKITFKRVLSNKIFLLNTVAGVFYFFGTLPYWVFSPKYIESQYRQSASESSFLTGSVALVFTALGIVIAGAVISKLKPSARKMGAWNAFVGIVSAFAMISYMFLGCPANDNSMIITQPLNEGSTSSCISNCHCDYVKYSPVCGEDGHTYISACHAGCLEQKQFSNGSKYFENCGCITPVMSTNVSAFNPLSNYKGGSALPGACTVNCSNELVIFVMVMCFTKFIGATGRASNFLISVRCVREEDKAVSMGIAVTIMSFFSFIPSPIFFGWLIDQTCSVWGKTCMGTGNCWLYDNELLRYWMNLAAALATFVGFFCDIGIWLYLKNLVIFDQVEEIKNGDNTGLKLESEQYECKRRDMENKIN